MFLRHVRTAAAALAVALSLTVAVPAVAGAAKPTAEPSVTLRADGYRITFSCEDYYYPDGTEVEDAFLVAAVHKSGVVLRSRDPNAVFSYLGSLFGVTLTAEQRATVNALGCGH